MAMATVNGTQLYYEVAGTGGLPLVLVHGSWGDHHNWGKVVPALARSFRVLTFDRRGHSQSARGIGAGTLEQDALDLAALLEALDLAPAHVVGGSFGASVALRLAGERPELFRSLTAHEPPLFALLEDEPLLEESLARMRERVEAVLALLARGDASSGARLFVETIAFGAGAWDSLPERARRTFAANASTWMEELEDPAWATLDLERLRRYTGPALITRGDQSAPFFPAVAARIAQALPQATQHLFAGAGHVPHLEQPAIYVDVVSQFVEEASRRAARPAEILATREPPPRESAAPPPM